MTNCTHERLVLTFNAPVYVTVANGTITRVRVDKEADTNYYALCCGDCGQEFPVVETHGTMREMGALFQQVTAIADACDDWPGWEFGA